MFRKIGSAFRRFMRGRYGSDELNMALLVGAVLLSIVNALLGLFLRENFVYASVVSPVLYTLMLLLLVFNIFRCFSRNIYKRRQENRHFVNFLTRLRDREHRYFRCPSCKQRVRVPRGKGKLNIRCPKCGCKFIRKS